MRLERRERTRWKLTARALSFSIVGCALIGVSNCPSVAIPLGQAAVDAASCRESLHSSRQALAASPNDSTLALELARTLAQCAQYPEAVARYRDILKSKPNNAAVQIELGDAL